MKGRIWIRIGLLCIVIALLLSSYNLYHTWNACIQSQSAVNEIIPSLEYEPLVQGEIEDYILNPDMDLPKKEINGNIYVGIIQIPALHLELPVLSECNDSNLNIAPCRYTGTCYKNNFIIGAHNSYYHFGNIKNLNQGDTITFIDMKDRKFEYQVAGIEILMPNQGVELESGDWDLSLFTCTWAGYSRVIVRCMKV
ncbi:sortase [Floccifex sp.]|uniref:sortase n=1 Tax=Floccifex sp. TaxID=2815810 RepID=UPI003F0822DA